MFKILDKKNGEVTAEQQAVFNKISTNNADGYVDGFLNSLRIAKMSSNVISIDSGLLSIQGFRSVNDKLTTYTVSVTPSEPIPFQLVATYSHYISDENDTLEITTRPVQELRREPLFTGQNAVYEVELAEFNMTADGIADFKVTLEKIVYNEQDLSELLDKVTKAEQDSATALEKVKELETQVIEKQGTAIYVGGTAQSRVDFTSDPQGQIDDIVDGTTKVKKAETADSATNASKLGGVNAENYAQLSQVVRTDVAQSLTGEQKQQARDNINALPINNKTLPSLNNTNVTQTTLKDFCDSFNLKYGESTFPLYFESGTNFSNIQGLIQPSGVTYKQYNYLQVTRTGSTYMITVYAGYNAQVQMTIPPQFFFVTSAGISPVLTTVNYLKVDPTKLTPSTDPESGWTKGTTESKLPGAGVYWVSLDGLTPITVGVGLLPFDGTTGGTVLPVLDTGGTYVVTATSSGFTVYIQGGSTPIESSTVWFKKIG